jgi:hypothetical protein
MIDVPADALQAIGEVAVTCGSLEWAMAELVTLLDHKADPDRLLSYSWQLTDDLERATRTLTGLDPLLGGELEAWRVRAENHRLDRHVLVHSVYLLDDEHEPPTLTIYNARAALEEPFDLGKARQFCHQMERHIRASWPIQQRIVDRFPRDQPGPADYLRTVKGGGV